MGTFNITSSTLNSQYEYKDANLVVNGSFAKDATTSTLQSFSGSCYRINAEGRNSNLVWAAIDEIEANVTGINTEE